MITKLIPSTGEPLPVVADVERDPAAEADDRLLQDECAAVMAAVFEAGGRMIDSSPMYGSAQATIGYGLRKLGGPSGVFSADKVWIGDPADGRGQIERSRENWGVLGFDLRQVHNLVSWQRHLETLLAMKADRQLRYVGITTSEGRRHAQIERVMASQPIDFVQVTYNVVDREVEARVLPLARERGIAVIVNRPFREGRLLDQLERQPLPAWVAETGAASWAQFILKFIVAHPAVMCAIPATTRVDHVRENMAAALGALPEEAIRQRMAHHVAQL